MAAKERLRSRRPSDRLSGLDLLDLVLDLQIKRELHDGLDDDRVDDLVEAVGVEAVEEEGPALAGGMDVYFCRSIAPLTSSDSAAVYESYIRVG